MLIEQTIEFELLGLGSLGRTCTPENAYFHLKHKNLPGKSSREILFNLLLKILQEAMCLAFPFWAKWLIKFNYLNDARF